MARKAAIAILMCAVLVLVAAAPLALADTHYVIKGGRGPRASAVTWEYETQSFGTWSGHIVNNGLRSVLVDVFDITSGALEQVSHQSIRFPSYDAYPVGVIETAGVEMGIWHVYWITVTPNGPKGSSCTVDDVFREYPPKAIFTIVSMDYLTVVVDGSLSDADGTIVSYDWTFGDGSSATGVTATHTYATEGTYPITLKVTDDLGYNGWSSQEVTLVTSPIASFNYTVDGLTVNVDASSSSSAVGIVSYEWDWGDGTTGTGMTATHTYSVANSTVKSLPTELKSSLSGRGRPAPPHPIWGYTYGPDGVTPMNGCVVVVMDLRTGESIVWDENHQSWDPTINAYVIDMAEFRLGYLIGDILNVTATKDNYFGWNEAPVTSADVDQIDVTLYLPNTIVKTITLTVTDTKGQTDTVTHSFVLAPPPFASFTLTVDGMTVSVDASGSSGQGGIVSYAWDWGDDTTGSGIIASHTYGVAKSATLGSESSRSRQPPPHPIYGYTFGPDGVTPINECFMKFTNVRTRESITYQQEPDTNVYVVDDGMFYWNYVMNGDMINITATASTYIGWAEYAINLSNDLDGPWDVALKALCEPYVPHLIFGYTYAPDGVTPMNNSLLKFTNLRTGEFLSYRDLSAWTNYYLYDLAAFYMFGDPENGEIINITAARSFYVGGSFDTYVGWVEHPVNWSKEMEGPWNVTLHQVVEPLTVTITLTVTDTLGQTATASQQVVMYP